MDIPENDLEKCVELANELCEYYNFDAMVNCTKKSLDDLIRFTRTFLGKDVQIKDLELRTNPDTTFRGVMLPRNDTHYEIYVLKEADEDLRRLVTCKELFQAALDSPDIRNLDLYDHISALVYQDMQDPSLAVIAELMAEVAAMQFLYPYADRVEDIKRINEKQTSSEKIAESYGIPLFYVEKYLTKKTMAALQTSHGIKIATNSDISKNKS